MVNVGILEELKRSYSEQGVTLTEAELEDKTKLQVMDEYFSLNNNISAKTVFDFVQKVFAIDLQKAAVLNSELLKSLKNPSPQEALNHLLRTQDKDISGETIRYMVNNIFGVNLNGIVSLEGKRISLYSKDQWIVQGENDLFIVSTGKNDLDVKVEISDYFKETTGLEDIPLVLKETLEEVGFTCHDGLCCYYATPDQKPVPDAFKGRTLGLIMKIIDENYANL